MRLSSILCVAGVVALSLPAHANAAPSDTLTFKSVTAGATHTCALTANGRAYCWGGNSEGQLGTGAQGNSATPRSLVPVPVTGGLTFRAVSAGGDHACGITDDLTAYCWGSN